VPSRKRAMVPYKRTIRAGGAWDDLCQKFVVRDEGDPVKNCDERKGNPCQEKDIESRGRRQTELKKEGGTGNGGGRSSVKKEKV